MLQLLSKLKPLFSLLLFLYIVGSSVALYTLYQEVAGLKGLKPYENKANLIYWTENSTTDEGTATQLDQGNSEVITSSEFTYKDCSDCDEEIAKLIDEKVKLAPIDPQTKTTVVKSPQQTSYVPLGTTSSSTSTQWYTLEDTSSFIDLKNDFSTDAYVTFEASLKVAYGNGSAFARLWDDTNKIAVNGSEITTTANSDFAYSKSGQIYLWNGNNNYKVQVKSLNGYEVTVTGAKIKVVY